MKLYTEKEVRNGIILGKTHLQKKTLFEILDMLSPIELPSDEEIENRSYTDIRVGDSEYEQQIGFEKGAKWMKEQILNKNK